MNHEKKFGECCKDLADALNVPANSLFFKSEEDILNLSVGYQQTEAGLAWFDQAVIFCPFCGTKIQDKMEIQLKINGTLEV